MKTRSAPSFLVKTRAVARKQLLSAYRTRPSTALLYSSLVFCPCLETRLGAQRTKLLDEDQERTEFLREDQGGRQEAAAERVQGQAQHSPVVLVSGVLTLQLGHRAVLQLLSQLAFAIVLRYSGNTDQRSCQGVGRAERSATSGQ